MKASLLTGDRRDDLLVSAALTNLLMRRVKEENFLLISKNFVLPDNFPGFDGKGLSCLLLLGLKKKKKFIELNFCQSQEEYVSCRI